MNAHIFWRRGVEEDTQDNAGVVDHREEDTDQLEAAQAWKAG